MERERDESSESDEEEKTAPPIGGTLADGKKALPTVAMDIITEEEEEEKEGRASSGTRHGKFYNTG